jgi:hypothetical protein
MRRAVEQVRAGAALVFADEVDLPVLPQGGSQWVPEGEQGAGLPPGTNAERYLAGALALTTGKIPRGVW